MFQIYDIKINKQQHMEPVDFQMKIFEVVKLLSFLEFL